MAPLRALAAWLAAVAVLVQLTATVACAAGDVVHPHGPFPICHASSVETPGLERKDAPAPARKPTHAHDACPFCSTCCHAAVGLPATSGGAPVPAPMATVVVDGRHPTRPAGCVRLCPAASPRGPPTLA